jgi:hypothetical protein
MTRHSREAPDESGVRQLLPHAWLGVLGRGESPSVLDGDSTVSGSTTLPYSRLLLDVKIIGRLFKQIISKRTSNSDRASSPLDYLSAA